MCNKSLGSLLPSPFVKLKDKISLRMDIPAGATSQFPLRGINDKGVLNSSWTEDKSSDFFLAMPNGIGYVDLPEECKESIPNQIVPYKKS